MKKTIDVIIPVYNGLPYILETLRSVMAQTMKPDRILVVNDGSTDKTYEEVKKIQENHPEFNILIINKVNGGHSSATNEGIRQSQSDFIALVDADDVWYPTKLEKQMEVFETSQVPNLGVVYTNFDSIDQNGKVINFPTFIMDLNAKGNLFNELICRGNLIAGSNSAVLVKRECFAKAGFFDEFLRCGEDWDMWIRIAQDFNYDYAKETLVSIRRHPHNLSNVPMIHLKSNLYILQKWVSEIHNIGGFTLVADHLSVATISNLKNLFFERKNEKLREYVSDLSKGFPYPRLIIAWGLARKIRKKIFKIIFKIKIQISYDDQ